MKPRAARHSHVEMTQIVLPPDSNPMGTAFGGTIAGWIDVAGAVAALRHARMPVVTAAIDELSFLAPVHLGDVVILKAAVNAVFHTSMEVGVRVECEDVQTGRRTHTVSAYLTFVAVDAQQRPLPLPPLLARTALERRRQVDAQRRRKERLARRRSSHAARPARARSYRRVGGDRRRAVANFAPRSRIMVYPT